MAINLKRGFDKDEVRHHKNDNRVADTCEDPKQVVSPIENCTLLPDIVKFGHQSLELCTVNVRIDILVPNSFGCERKSSENHIVTRDIVIIVDRLP